MTCPMTIRFVAKCAEEHSDSFIIRPLLPPAARLKRNSRKTGTPRPREFLTLFRGTDVPFALAGNQYDANKEAVTGRNHTQPAK